MEVRIVKKDRGANFLSKVSGILFGIFLTSIIFAIGIQLLEEIGLYIGLGLTVLFIVIGFIYSKPRTTLRMIVWGKSATVVIGTALYIIGMTMISNLLEGF